MAEQELSLTANGFEWNLISGVIDDEAIEAFTCGHCHSFAAAVSILTGWDIMVLENTAYQTLPHVFCLAPDMLAVDIEGVLRLDHFVMEWETREETYINGEELGVFLAGEEGSPISDYSSWEDVCVAEAMPFALALLSQHGLAGSIQPAPLRSATIAKLTAMKMKFDVSSVEAALQNV